MQEISRATLFFGAYSCFLVGLLAKDTEYILSAGIVLLWLATSIGEEKG